LICSGKGGVGKTTLTANLGIALAQRGSSTVVLDADFGLRNLDLLLGLENRIVYTAQEVLAETCRLDQALVKHKQVPNLALLPAGNPRMLEWLKPEDMQAIASMLEKRFDYVLIDCPAGIEDGFKNAVAAAREAIVITTPEVSAVRDADRVIGLLNTHGVSPVQLVLNRVRPKMMANQEMLAVDDVTDILALPLLGLVLEDEQGDREHQSGRTSHIEWNKITSSQGLRQYRWPSSRRGHSTAGSFQRAFGPTGHSAPLDANEDLLS
jgi:septum site-determining protein MinD